MQKAINEIMSKVTNECVITSCGYISREVFRAKDRPRNFYVLGSMGMALSVGIGLAYSRRDLEVIVISGDGAVLMSMGTMALHAWLVPDNLKHYILDNNSYASTGGQKTCSEYLEIGGYNTEAIKVDKESNAPRIPLGCKEIRRRFCEAIKEKSSSKYLK